MAHVAANLKDKEESSDFASLLEGRYFECLLTRFSEPNELFGPVDLAKLKEGVVDTRTAPGNSVA